MTGGTDGGHPLSEHTQRRLGALPQTGFFFFFFFFFFFPLSHCIIRLLFGQGIHCMLWLSYGWWGGVLVAMLLFVGTKPRRKIAATQLNNSLTW
jgi:hypothetical protein